MAKIGNQIEHQRSDAVVDDPTKYVAVVGDPIKKVETDPKQELEILMLTTVKWPYPDVKRT